jgi:hypothetical protein
MLYKKFKILFFVGFLAILGSCKTNDNKSLTIRGFVRYISGTEQVKVQLNTFINIKDTISVIDTLNRNIFFQGQRIPRFNLGTGQTYNYEMSPVKPGDFYISLENEKKEEIRFDFEVLPIEEITPKSFSKANGVEISVKLNPKDNAEGLILMLIDDQEYTAQEVFDIKGKTEAILKIPADKIKNLHAGNVKYYLVKKQIIINSKENINLDLETEYYSEEKTSMID